ncbi:MAG: hypothetical protein OQL19_17760 [Gammaproteobacteria bacterium]|nr:hypothetical protein [Gammaproteobacteria bacterium]
MNAEQLSSAEMNSLNEQQEAKQSAISELRSNSELTQLPKSITSFFDSRINQFEGQTFSDSNNFEKALNEMKNSINKLAELKNNLSENE